MKTFRKIQIFGLILIVVVSTVKNIQPTSFQFAIVCLGWAMSLCYINNL